MTAVLNAVCVYIALLVIFRLAGRRSLGDITNFDMVVLLIISEAVQQALIRDDYSLTNAILVVATLIILDVGLSLLRLRFRKLNLFIEGVPTILIENGKVREHVMLQARVDLSDIMEAARRHHGLERQDQIRYAVLETNGEISIIPAPQH